MEAFSNTPMTITEKILAKSAGKSSVKPGDNIWVDIDVLMTHDVFGPAVVRIFKEKFGEEAKVWDKEKLVIIPDHYIFTEDKFAHRNIELLDNFAIQQGLPNYYSPNSDRYSGVCHVTLAQEGFNTPGNLLLGTDSHTCTSGAFGMFSTGIGNTEAAYVMGKGRLWLRVPESIKVVFDGKMPDYLMAKDLILALIGDIGVDGATYKTLEFCGTAIDQMSMEERMTLCNMAIEAGAKNGIIAADEVTRSYASGRFKQDAEYFRSDENASYCLEKYYNVEKLKPVVAKPHSPDNKALIDEVSGTPIDRAYVGSCTGGKIEDFKAAASLLKGKNVAVDTFIVPATREVENSLHSTLHEGESLYNIFVSSGCKIGKPSCAACVGGPLDTFGRTKGAETVVSSTNRNFPGRMGAAESSVYLASPLTVVASALVGTLASPVDLIEKS